ncbi:MAG: peptidoglycan DD-metalloendopeptidase family protein, partial [Bacteroidota bacterium]
TKQNREATFTTFVTLQKQISKRQQLIETLRAEIQYLAQNVERTTSVIESLTSDIARLKEEYANMARHAYRQKLGRSEWLFVLSARSFNEAFRRWQYLRQYDRYRQKQAHLIVETQQSLLEKLAGAERRKVEKERLLASQQRQTTLLNYEKEAKNALLQDLKGDESRLAKDLETKRVAADKLDAAIERIIREEVERARRPERSNAAAPAATPETESLSNEFKGNRGKLPWPVKNGVITGYFGRQKHPTIPSVEIVNNGIDIRTDQGAAVRVVFEGTVVGTQYIPGFEYMVIVQHGNYYSVYSNLEEISVKKGDPVNTRQNIGKVSTDRKTNTSEVHFEIWKEKTRLNPAEWVGSK